MKWFICHLFAWTKVFASLFVAFVMVAATRWCTSAQPAVCPAWSVYSIRSVSALESSRTWSTAVWWADVTAHWRKNHTADELRAKLNRFLMQVYSLNRFLGSFLYQRSVDILKKVNKINLISTLVMSNYSLMFVHLFTRTTISMWWK